MGDGFYNSIQESHHCVDSLHFLGAWGVDRFYIGSTGVGVAKLLTCGGFGVWTIIDWFLISGATKEQNYNKLQTYLY